MPWLWYRPAATALIRPLAWELLYAADVALKSKKKKKKKERERESGKEYMYVSELICCTPETNTIL